MTDIEVVAYIVERWRRDYPLKRIPIELLLLGQTITYVKVLEVVLAYIDRVDETRVLGRREGR